MLLHLGARRCQSPPLCWHYLRSKSSTSVHRTAGDGRRDFQWFLRCKRWTQSVAQMSKPFQALLVYSATPEGLLSPSFANEKLHLETWLQGIAWKSTKCCTRNIKKPRGMKRNKWIQELWCERTHETTAILRLELWEVPANLAQHLRASLQLCWQSFGHVFNNVTVEVREQQCEETGGCKWCVLFFFPGEVCGNWKYIHGNTKSIQKPVPLVSLSSLVAQRILCLLHHLRQLGFRTPGRKVCSYRPRSQVAGGPHANLKQVQNLRPRCKRSGRHSLRHPGSILGISLDFIGKLGTGLVDAWIYLRMNREYGHDGMTCTSGELETRHRTYAQNRHPALVLRTRTKAGTGSQSLMAKLSLWYSAARGWLSPTNHDTSGAKTLQGPTSAHLDSEEWLGWSKCGCASDTQQSTSQGS